MLRPNQPVMPLQVQEFRPPESQRSIPLRNRQINLAQIQFIQRQPQSVVQRGASVLVVQQQSPIIQTPLHKYPVLGTQLPHQRTISPTH